MTPAVRTLGLVQSLSMLAMVAILLRPHARWSRRARAPVAVMAILASATHLLLIIL